MRICVIFSLIMAGCNAGGKMIGSHENGGFSPDFSAGPPTIIYKTRADYSNNVPIILSEDKTVILSYPAPADLKPDGAFSTPTLLKNGYLLDNRGVNANVAFLKMSYQEYSKRHWRPPPYVALSFLATPFLRLKVLW